MAECAQSQSLLFSWALDVVACLQLSSKPFRQRRFSRGENRRYRQLAALTVLLPQAAQITGAISFEHARTAHPPPPPTVSPHKSPTEGTPFGRRFRLPFFARI